MLWFQANLLNCLVSGLKNSLLLIRMSRSNPLGSFGRIDILPILSPSFPIKVLRNFFLFSSSMIWVWLFVSYKTLYFVDEFYLAKFLLKCFWFSKYETGDVVVLTTAGDIRLSQSSTSSRSRLTIGEGFGSFYFPVSCYLSCSQTLVMYPIESFQACCMFQLFSTCFCSCLISFDRIYEIVRIALRGRLTLRWPILEMYSSLNSHSLPLSVITTSWILMRLGFFN